MHVTVLKQELISSGLSSEGNLRAARRILRALVESARTSKDTGGHTDGVKPLPRAEVLPYYLKLLEFILWPQRPRNLARP